LTTQKRKRLMICKPQKKECNRNAKQNGRTLQQTELKGEMLHKGKIEELIVRKLKTCEKNMQ
jgi:hypothetical protein